MARLFTAGAEVDGGSTGTTASPDGTSLSGAVTRDTATKRSGLAAWKFDSAAGAGANVRTAAVTVTSVSVYLRVYINSTTNPTNNIMILGPPSAIIAVRLRTDGALSLIVNGVAQGSNSAVLTDGLWHRVEMAFTCDGSNNITSGELRVDAATVSTFSGSQAFGAASAAMVWGYHTNPGASKIIYMDDVAVNDSSGSAQNTWAGEGQVVMLLPTATSASGTGWTLGTGTAEGGNGWDSVNNEPPVGVADLAAGSDPKQIRNAAAAANSNFDTTMQTYTAAGIPFGASVNVVDPVVITAAPVATSAKTGTVGVVSNPAIANIDLNDAGTANAFWSGVAAGTYPTGWKTSHGTITAAPAVTLATAPVMRITQVTSSTRIAMVCFMGMYVDYAVVQPAERVVLTAMNRAGNW